MRSIDSLEERSLRRPAKQFKGSTAITCPTCKSVVNDTLGAHPVPRRRLGGQNPKRVHPEVIHVRGYACENCDCVLALSPDAANVDPSGWATIGAVFTDMSQRPVMIPRKQLKEDFR